MGYLTLVAVILLQWNHIATPSIGTDYDPLKVTTQIPKYVDTIVADTERAREIPLWIYLPAEDSPAAIILFSHGLGGSRAGSAYLGYHWAARGYVVVFLQHPGSDETVWNDKPLLQRMSAMRRAAGVENFLLRIQDVSAVLDQLTMWNSDKAHFLAGRLDTNHVGMSGHSFGAMTTQAVSGQDFPKEISFTDTRIDAAVMMSPSTPRRGGDPQLAFSQVKIPWMLLTGTHDDAQIGNSDAASRLRVFPALPTGRKYQLVLDGAEHSAFSDRKLPGDKQQRNPQHHRSILAVTTAFWDATLHENSQAATWLEGEQVRSVLSEQDQWQKK